MRITAETLGHVTAAIDRMVAVSDFARHGAVTDERVAAAGFYTDESLGSPETLLFGPEGDFEHGCDVAGAWEAHTELCSGDVEYHVGAGNDGAMTMVMRVPAADPNTPSVELTVGMNDRIGLHGDPVTITALGGTPSHAVTGIASSEFDHDTGMAVDLQNLNAAGVSAADRDRLWTALNEASHSHPDAQLVRHYVHDGDTRDLPDHEQIDRTLLGIEQLAPPPGAVSPPRAGSPQSTDRNREAPAFETETPAHSW